MTKSNYTAIVIVLDRSRSMESCREGTISGFNEFLASQQQQEGEATLSLIQFDDHYEKVHDFRPLSSISPLNNYTFQPRGMTCLHGAVGRTIDEFGQQLAAMPESRRPDKVVFVTITDGGENSSHANEWAKQYNAENVAERTRHQTEKYDWQFVYLGANQDAVLTARSLGMNANMSATYNSTNVGSAYTMEKLSGKMSAYRSSGDVNDLAFNAQDRAELAATK